MALVNDDASPRHDDDVHSDDTFTQNRGSRKAPNGTRGARPFVVEPRASCIMMHAVRSKRYFLTADFILSMTGNGRAAVR